MPWELLPYNSPLLPIHAALLRTGKVFFFAGSGNNPNTVGTTNDSVVWDVNNNTFSHPATPLDPFGIPIDYFCSGHSFLPDGRLMVVGGTEQYDPFHGLPSALVFDPITEQWTQAAPMNSGRWYPTAMTLADGRILALSGKDENGSLDTYPEIYAPATGWTAFTQPTSRFQMYAHFFLLSSGKLFYSGAQVGGNNGVSPRILTLPSDRTQLIVETPVSGLIDPSYGREAASVLLPPAHDQKVMIIGGGTSQGNGASTTNRVNIVDLKATTPTYTPAAPLNYARMHHNAVLLPDRTVFVCNGSSIGENGAQATRAAEIYNPATNTWKVVETANVTRLYHSVALLLPDGRVITASGNPTRSTQELRLEIYSPAYMSKVRPTIFNAPSTVTYNQLFTIETPDANNIQWVSLIKPMVTTHGLDTEQRVVSVPIQFRTSSALTVRLTSIRNNLPLGYYMLFISNKQKVPSVAKWVQVALSV